MLRLTGDCPLADPTLVDQCPTRHLERRGADLTFNQEGWTKAEARLRARGFGLEDLVLKETPRLPVRIFRRPSEPTARPTGRRRAA